MYCPICGTKLVEGARFCHQCGEKAPVLNKPLPAIPASESPAVSPAGEAAFEAYTAEPIEAPGTATSVAFTFENGYDPGSQPDAEPAQPQNDGRPKPLSKKSIIWLSIVAGVLLLAIAAGTLFGLQELYGRRDRAKLSEALCHTWQLEDPGDGSVVLLAFHSDGSGICTRQAWLFEETIAAVSYDVTGKDTIVLHYNGADLEYVVTFEQDKTALTFSPHLLVQNRPDERWTIYRANP